jgi:ribose-phosphate pyrophosphokinase
MPLLARYAREKHLVGDNVVVVGPDEEAEYWASLAANEINAEHIYLRKTRLGDREVKIEAVGDVKVNGKDVLVVDDIISTGGTIIEAFRVLRSLGARNTVVGVTHALLVENALGRILREGVNEVYSTDTVPNPTTRISVAPVVAQAIREVAKA